MSRQKLKLVILLFFLFFSFFYFAFAFFAPQNYYLLFLDDGFNELLTIFAYLGAAILFLMIFFSFKFRGGWFYLFLALFALLVIGEELSWGQRFFSVKIPDFFMRYNANQSLNLHNLYIFEPWEDEISLTFYLSWGIFLPALIFSLPKLKDFWQKFNLPAPSPEISLGLSLGFLVEFYAALVMPDYPDYAFELVELFLAFSFFWVGISTLKKFREKAR